MVNVAASQTRSEEQFSFAHFRQSLDTQFSFRSDDSFVCTDGDVAVNPSGDVQGMTTNESSWLHKPLVIVVVGASGDLARRKTYPSLFELYQRNLLPPQTIIYGYARSPKTHEELRSYLHPHLAPLQSAQPAEAPHNTLKHFLEKCYYHYGQSYGDHAAYAEMLQAIAGMEGFNAAEANVLYYLAIPPNVFHETVTTLEKIPTAVVPGKTKVVIEKPFGRDTESCKELLENFKGLGEKMQYRLDHYLAKPMVENIVTLRMANPWLELMWSHQFVESIHIRFKEPFGTQGRGGYFNEFGIIRDVLQNHILQVLLLVAMELPESDKHDQSDSFRQAKIAVLKNMPPIRLEDALFGQYDGYRDDPTIKDKDTNCPTYAALRCFVNNDRWKGVPFIMEAGKALDQKIVDVQVKLKNRHPFPSNVLTIEIQPKMALSLTAHMKPLDLSSSSGAKSVVTTSLTAPYPQPRNDDSTTKPVEDAYARLLLDVLRGNQSNFVRADELVASWELFTPLLEQTEQGNVQPLMYPYGSSGPTTRAAFLEKMIPSTQSSL